MLMETALFPLECVFNTTAAHDYYKQVAWGHLNSDDTNMTNCYSVSVLPSCGLPRDPKIMFTAAAQGTSVNE